MKLYHGTSEAHARKILRAGAISPRGKRRGNWKHTVASSDTAVYLTDAYAPYFAINALSMGDIDKRVPGLRGAVFEIDSARLAVWNMGCDEDVPAHVLQGHDKLPKGWSLNERSAHYRKHLLDYSWEKSLEIMGTCSHRGHIPISAVTRVAYFDIKAQAGFTLASLDPLIHPMNYKFVGAKYRRMTRWLFDGVDDAAPGLPEIERALLGRLPETRDGIEIVEMQKAAA